MRTTIEIPDPLFRKIKSQTALRGESLKSFFTRAAAAELEKPEAPRPKKAQLPFVRSTGETFNVSPEHLAEVLTEEDSALLG